MSKRIVVEIVSALLLISVFSLTFNIQPAQSEAQTIIVPDDYSSIQGAINAANAGDTIYVKSGSYSENVYVNKAVALIGAGRESTSISCGEGTPIQITADNVTVAGFTLSGARSASGLWVSNVKGVNVTGNTVTGGAWADALVVSGVSNSTFSGNNLHHQSYENAKSLAVTSSSFNTFSGNDILFCSVDSSFNNIFSGGNIFQHLLIQESSFNTFSGNTIIDWLSFHESSNNVLYGNDITGSAFFDPINTWDTFSSSNDTWNATYSLGGNYWSNYIGVDLKKGSNQDQLGHDGIGDTPYVMNANNTDYYPLMKPYAQFSIGAPFSHFNYTPNKLAGETVTFNASDSYDINGNIVNYAWDFGDDATATSASPVATHAYGNVHSNTVKLTVTDNDGLTDTSTQTVTVGMVPASISISTSSSSMFAGFKVDVAGTLRDVYGNGLKDKTIVLSYTFSGIGTWTPITSCTTDNAGNYLATWIPTATGAFTLNASWNGTSTVSPANSTTTLNCLSYNQYVFSVESNSTISGLAFNATGQTLSFTATGSDGTKGYVRATLSKNFTANPAGVKVLIDGNQIACSPTSTSDSCLIYFTYQHSTHTVLIDLSAAAQPTPTPTPTPTATPTPTPTPTSTQTPQPTPTPTSTSNPTATPQPGENPFTNWMLYVIPVAVAIIIIAVVLAWKRKKLFKSQTAQD